MKRITRISAATGLCAVFALSLAAGPARADGNPFVGRWHWNRAQSTLPAGEPIPADMVANFARVDASHVRWSITTTDAKGHSSVQKFDTPANGEFYPISGDATASFQVKGATLQAIFKGEDGESDTLTCMVSSDQKTMTCKGLLTGTDGKAEPYLDVYDRG